MADDTWTYRAEWITVPATTGMGAAAPGTYADLTRADYVYWRAQPQTGGSISWTPEMLTLWVGEPPLHPSLKMSEGL